MTDRTDWKATATRMATALAVTDLDYAEKVAGQWRRQGYVVDADLLAKEVAFWRAVFEGGFEEAIEMMDDRLESAA